jgi:hypothetical protein
MPSAASPSASGPRHPTNANVTARAARGGRILLPRPHVVDRPDRVEGAERVPTAHSRPSGGAVCARHQPVIPDGNTLRLCARTGHSGMCDPLQYERRSPATAVTVAQGLVGSRSPKPHVFANWIPGRETMCRHRIGWATLPGVVKRSYPARPRRTRDGMLPDSKTAMEAVRVRRVALPPRRCRPYRRPF